MANISITGKLFGPKEEHIPLLVRQRHQIRPEQTARMESKANSKPNQVYQNDSSMDTTFGIHQQSNNFSTSTETSKIDTSNIDKSLVLNEICALMEVDDPYQLSSKLQAINLTKDEITKLTQCKDQLTKDLQASQDQLEMKNKVVESLDIKIETMEKEKNDLMLNVQNLNNKLEECSREAHKVTTDLLSSKKELELLEKESNSNSLLKDQAITNLEREVFVLKEKEMYLLKELDLIKASNLAIEKEKKEFDVKIENLRNSHQDEKNAIDRKMRALKKSNHDLELKCESLNHKLSTSKSHYNKKVTNYEKQHSKLLDQQEVEIKILRDIVYKKFGVSHPINFTPSSSPVEDMKQEINSNLFGATSDANLLYIRQLYEDRYLNALKENKDLLDSNSIVLSALTSLINENINYFNQIIPKNERFVYFVILCKEIRNRSIFKMNDTKFLKKIIENDGFLFKEVIDKFNHEKKR
ncbi:uncharacterized protein KGF55_005425 [Candida pseudojiufengensis]|uniref:uncharacterized protein n=1 Tax=Candida pseudojiufengensis TaxID=497109 RepID=UPI0022259E2E|nr:uncharacterized protein KGF55_005425 [Candida pseudojiufengensis]KAI5959275.1 hypothetical protein KGF55_005425 [Candida pseudojiufengensis]